MIAIAPEETMRSSTRVTPSPANPETSFGAICTLIIWILCLTIGALGMAMPYQRPHPPAAEPPPLQAQVLQVELTQDPLPPPDLPRASQPLEPPTLQELAAPTEAPPMIAVAEPSPAISFALPVEGPTRIVEAKQAAYTKPAVVAVAPVAAAPAVQPLTYGQGEGKQPAPIYPRRAARQGQQGTVGVRFTVGEDGRVLAVENVRPCPWPLLNEEALRVIREQWRFSPGSVRPFVIDIRFELKK